MDGLPAENSAGMAHQTVHEPVMGSGQAPIVQFMGRRRRFMQAAFLEFLPAAAGTGLVASGLHLFDFPVHTNCHSIYDIRHNPEQRIHSSIILRTVAVNGRKYFDKPRFK